MGSSASGLQSRPLGFPLNLLLYYIPFKEPEPPSTKLLLQLSLL